MLPIKREEHETKVSAIRVLSTDKVVAPSLNSWPSNFTWRLTNDSQKLRRKHQAKNTTQKSPTKGNL